MGMRPTADGNQALPMDPDLVHGDAGPSSPLYSYVIEPQILGAPAARPGWGWKPGWTAYFYSDVGCVNQKGGPGTKEEGAQQPLPPLPCPFPGTHRGDSRPQQEVLLAEANGALPAAHKTNLQEPMSE